MLDLSRAIVVLDNPELPHAGLTESGYVAFYGDTYHYRKIKPSS